MDIDKIIINNQGCPMKIIEYNNSRDVVVEFQDEYKVNVRTTYEYFKNGIIKNPYYPSVFNVGMIGNKYPSHENVNGKSIALKEYNTWIGILIRCYSEKYKNIHTTYENVTCCNEWLLYDNFYEWLHSQENFDKWNKNKMWAIDKDILIKGNKIYSPETCCLVPPNVNCLFVKKDKNRGELPIGVRKHKNKFRVSCMNPFENKYKHVGMYNTLEEAFYIGYKPYKEDIIKQVAQNEYGKENITKECYNAMMNYKVEITD